MYLPAPGKTGLSVQSNVPLMIYSYLCTLSVPAFTEKTALAYMLEWLNCSDKNHQTNLPILEILKKQSVWLQSDTLADKTKTRVLETPFSECKATEKVMFTS